MSIRNDMFGWASSNERSNTNPNRGERRPDAFVDRDDVRLACYRDGDPERPTLVFVHGFPDTAAIWDPIIEILANRYHCIRYDVRGAGQSDRPARTNAYRLDRLVGDLAAVLDWAAPGRSVHLIGHDWGSIQGWEAATEPTMAARIASFTTLSGPCLDHIGYRLRDRHFTPRARRRQARRSWYILLFHIPIVAPLVWRYGLAPRWARIVARLEGGVLPLASTLRADGHHGIKLYRANIRPYLYRPRARRAVVPVHAVVARRDAFVGPALLDNLDAWVDDLCVDTIDAGHWAIATHAVEVARLIERYLGRVVIR